MAGSADQDLPGIGTFSYNGSPIAIQIRDGRDDSAIERSDRSLTEQWTLTSLRLALPEITGFFPRLFRQGCGDETILRGHETISCFGADIRKQRMVINPAITKRRTAPAAKSGDSQMQTLSLSLPSLSCWSGPALAGTSDIEPAGHRHLCLQRLADCGLRAASHRCRDR